MPDGRIRWALAVLAVLALLGTGAGWYAQAHRPPPVVISAVPGDAPPAIPMQTISSPQAAPAPLSTVPPKAAAPALFYVHVAGAVRHPSLYQLPPGARVLHAIKAAGGPTAKADLDALNLAEKVRDGEKVFVPTHAAVAAATAPPAPAVSSTAFVTPAAPASRLAKATSGKPAKLMSPAQGQVDINTANTDTLQRLPGIGPAMAERILAYRQQAGRFAATDELMQVSGIGPKKYAKIAPLVKL